MEANLWQVIKQVVFNLSKTEDLNVSVSFMLWSITVFPFSQPKSRFQFTPEVHPVMAELFSLVTTRI